MKYLVILWVMCTVQIGCVKQTVDVESQKAAILKVMAAQEKAWSDGDLEGFMQGYWHSAELTFVGKRGVTRGWAQTLRNYQKSYPSKVAMGTLIFDVIQLEKLNVETYHMIGKYKLLKKDENPSGHFTLVWKYIGDEWLIVTDHSS